MALVRWNPWGELFDLHSQMDQLFQSLASETPGTGNGTTTYMNLPVDIRQTDEAYWIEASVAGFRHEDVEVTFEDGVLTIRGQHRHEQEKKEGTWVRRERKLQSVYRQISLPAEVRADEISARFDNGVLHIQIPRAQKAQPKRIQVTTGGESQTGKVIQGQSRSEQTQTTSAG